MYHHLDVQELSDGRVAFKLELEPEHPRQPSLLMRSPGGQREQPLEFLAQADGRDFFTVVLSAPEPFEYALRVTTPAHCWWLTPKGEEHDRVPHNWFRWPQSPYWSWFHVRNWPFPESFGSHGEVLYWYDCWWGFHTLPKLNYENPEVQDYFLRVASFWLREADTDGWRLDVPNEVTQSFWPKFRHAVKAAKSDAYIVGEIWDDASPWLQGDQFDAVMNYRFQKALIAYFGEEDMDTCAFAYTLRDLSRAYPEPATAVMLNLLGSHDTVRPMTVVRRRDQARALESLKLMVAMQFTCAGAPCIYYGDEIGLEGDKDPDCRRCYPWGWEQQAEERAQRSELLAYYKRLIAVRNANPALRRGAFHLLEADPGRQLYAFERRAPDNRCIVALNRSGHDQAFPVSPDLPAMELLSNQPIRGDRVTVPARQAVIVRFEEGRRRIGRRAVPGAFWASAGRTGVSQEQHALA